jgi:hypothetical protein
MLSSSHSFASTLQSWQHHWQCVSDARIASSIEFLRPWVAFCCEPPALWSSTLTKVSFSLGTSHNARRDVTRPRGASSRNSYHRFLTQQDCLERLFHSILRSSDSVWRCSGECSPLFIGWRTALVGSSVGSGISGTHSNPDIQVGSVWRRTLLDWSKDGRTDLHQVYNVLWQFLIIK